MKPQLIITTDAPSGTALVRGVEAEPATRVVAYDTRRYSRQSRGWIVPMADVGDLLAYAGYYHVFAISHELKRGAA